MSDAFESWSILAAVPLGVPELGDPTCSLALLPCLGNPLSTRHYPTGEEL